MNWRNAPALRAVFGIDPRSLALFRIGIGVLLLTDLLIHVPDLVAMYTDEGMFSRGLIRRHYPTIWHWSFHFASGSAGVQAALFAIAGVLALALLVGFKTRWVSIGSWLMLMSLHHRVPPILSGADTLMRMLLFWAMFLPLERVWSLDQFLSRRRGPTARPRDEGLLLSVSSAAILLQMGVMYLYSAIFKLNSDWLSGNALAGTLAHDFYATPAGASLLAFPRLLSVLTWVALLLELLCPVLLFFPLRTARVRLALLPALAAFHIGIGVCLSVGLFPYVALVGLTLFLPPEFWNSSTLARFLRPFRFNAAIANAEPPVLTHSHPLAYLPERLCALLFAYVLAVNINSHSSRPLARLSPENWRPLAVGFGLRQRWGMFEGIPSRDGWFVVRGKQADGLEIDVLRGGAEVDWKRPEWPAGIYPNQNWHKLFREMAYNDELGYQVFRLPVATYLYRTWNSRNTAGKQLIHLDFIYCMEIEDPKTGERKIHREQLVALPSEPIRGPGAKTQF